MVSALQTPYQPFLPLGNTAAVPSLCIAKHKPIGGFVPITVIQLCLLWWLLTSHQIRLLDVRVWFACHELGEHARRCQLAPGQIPHYTIDELRQLLRLRRGPHAIRAALRRLEDLGLLTWGPHSLTFATSPSDLQGADLTGFYVMLDRIENNRRLVPVPRQLIRWIAQGCRRVRLATVLGHLMRCLYYKKEGICVSGGRCKSSWIARVFGVDHRQIKAERQRLLALGILEAGPPSPQWLLNREGPWCYVSMTWTQAGLREASTSRFDTYTSVQVKDATQLPPLPAAETTQLPPPCLNSEPLRGLGTELNHQKPAQADPAPAAVSTPLAPPSPSPADSGIQSVEDTTPQALPLAPPPSSPADSGIQSVDDHTPKAPLLPPSLNHIVLEDFEHVSRALTLYHQAQRQGLIGRSEAERLKFMSTVEHARAGVDPGALLADNIRHQRWHYDDAEEDAAHRRLTQHLYGIDPQHRTAPPPPPPGPPPALSKDAWCVHELQRQLRRHGFDGDVLALLRQEDPVHWTEAHCHVVAQELAQVQQAKCQMQSLEAGLRQWEPEAREYT
jgi:hypothetical protein